MVRAAGPEMQTGSRSVCFHQIDRMPGLWPPPLLGQLYVLDPLWMISSQTCVLGEHFVLHSPVSAHWGLAHITKGTSVQFNSVTRSCLTLWDPMNHSTPGLPVHHQLPESPKSISIESVMPSNHLTLCHLLLLPSIFPNIRVFSNEKVASGGQSIGVSASTSVLPMNAQRHLPATKCHVPLTRMCHLIFCIFWALLLFSTAIWLWKSWELRLYFFLSTFSLQGQA